MAAPHAAPSELRAGLNAGLPFALPTLALGVSFGVLARPVMGAIAPVVLSVAIFSGGARIAALSVLVAGGGVFAAAGAGLLVKARWLVMGFPSRSACRTVAWRGSRRRKRSSTPRS